MSVPCTTINDEPLSPSLVGNEKETNVFNSRFIKPDGSLHQVTNEIHAVTQVLEIWMHVPTRTSRASIQIRKS